ncbi:MAG: hypothetical protein EOL97_07135 [Spirochaetia bacterium]|nr:hypothetical protein [Spirochaetia bacterium]
MNKEFNLSERINTYEWDDDGTSCEDVIPVEDIKVFIKLLKELANGYDLEYDEHRIAFYKEIDKLAGKELI